MKSLMLVVSTAIAVCSASLMSGVSGTDNTASTRAVRLTLPDAMGSPTIDTVVAGVRMKIWLITQKERREGFGIMKMEGPRDSSMGMSTVMDRTTPRGMGMVPAVKIPVPTGSHRLRVDLTDAVTGSEITDASASIAIVSPSNQSATVHLRQTVNHFGGALSLSEKGTYRLSLNVTVDGVEASKQFTCEVR